jgi:hypothetical protein
VQGLAVHGADALLARAQSAEVLNGLGHGLSNTRSRNTPMRKALDRQEDSQLTTQHH